MNPWTLERSNCRRCTALLPTTESIVLSAVRPASAPGTVVLTAIARRWVQSNDAGRPLLTCRPLMSTMYCTLPSTDPSMFSSIAAGIVSSHSLVLTSSGLNAARAAPIYLLACFSATTSRRRRAAPNVDPAQVSEGILHRLRFVVCPERACPTHDNRSVIQRRCTELHDMLEMLRRLHPASRASRQQLYVAAGASRQSHVL